MATAKKLPSGNWRVQASVTINDKKQIKSFTAATPRKAELAAMEWQEHYKDIKSDLSSMTVKEAITEYIKSKENILSPSTINGYNTILKNQLKDIIDYKLRNINTVLLQKCINDDAQKLSPKTLKNVYGLLTAVLKKYCKNIYCDIDITYPQAKKQPMTSYDNDYISKLLKAISGKGIEIPALISIWLGLRASEISGLEWSCIDFKTHIMHIEQARIKNAEGKYIISERTKTIGSNRYLHIPDYIYNKLVERKKITTSDFITDTKPNQFWQRLRRATNQAGIAPIRFHDLRHINASVMLAQGINDKISMDRGGWSTNNIMKSVYQHTFTEQRKEADTKIDNYFTELIKTENNSHENSHEK